MATTTSRHRKSTFIGALIVIALLMLALLASVADWANNRRFEQEQRLLVQNELATIRARLEGNINANLETVRGLVAALSIEPNMTVERFNQLAEQVMQGRPQLRNLGAAPDFVIRYIYPQDGNEAILGFNYRTSPEQWEAAKRARDTGNLIVAGPLVLKQGGRALVGRVPVFTAGSGDSGREFWGLVSAVIDLQQFYDDSQLNQASRNLSLAILGRDGILEDRSVFYGNPMVFEQSPVLARVALPAGAWLIGAVPVDGWDATAESAAGLRAAVIAMLGLLGVSGFLVFRLARRAELQEARLQSLFELSPIGIALNDFDTGAFLEVNKALVQPSGYSNSEFVKLSYWDLTPETYKLQDQQQIETLRETGRYGPYEKEYIRKDGSRYPVLLNGTLVEDASGKKCIWSIIEDISARKEAEKALLESRSHLQSFFDLSSNLMCVASPDGYFKLLNSAFCRLLGFSKTELKLEPFISFVHPEDQESTVHAVKQLEEEGTLTSFVNRYRCKDGSYVYLNWSSVFDRNSGNIYASAMDVSHEREREDRLLQQQEMLESMSMLARIGAWEISFVDSAVYWSEMTKVIHEVGKDYQPTLQSALQYYKPGKSLTQVEHAVQVCLERGTSFSEEVQITTEKGRDLWVLVTGKADLKDGKCERIYGSYQDINARKLIEKNIETTQRELQQQMDMLRVIAQAQASFIEQSDVDKAFKRLLENILPLTASTLGFIGEILYLEEGDPYLNTWVFAGENLPSHYTEGAAPQQFYNQQNLLGEAFVSLRPVIANNLTGFKDNPNIPKDHPVVRSFLGIPIVHGGRGIAMVGLANRPGGYSEELVSWLNPLLNTVAQFVVGSRAIKARQQAERDLLAAKEAAELAAQAKSDFLAIMSHEIRTPLNGVMGMLGLLSRSNLNSEQSRKLDIAKQSSNTLLTIINDILDFSKVDAGKIELEYIDFNLVDQLEEFAESMAMRAQEKHLEFIVDTSEIRDAMVQGDPGRIRQILTNLVGNAIKFTKFGEVVVRCTLTPAGDDMEFRVSVSDTGIGIPPQKIAELFNPFTQVDASTTRQYGGTGLGLAICKKLCVLMHGDISAYSEPGSGSEFEFHLHLKRSESTERLPKYSLGGKRIFMIDDSATSCEFVRAWCTRWGAEVISAYDCVTAVERAREMTREGLAVDVVLMDQNLPDCSGVDLADRFRNENLLLNSPLVILNRIVDVSVAEYIEKGFCGRIAKPLTASKLRECLSIVLAGGTTLVSESVEDAAAMETVKASSSSGTLESELQRILLVEDNPVNQDVAQMMLEDLHVVVTVAGNGVEALHALKNAQNFDRYGMILMDCQMPEMDGYEAARQIRSGNGGERYKSIPIVAMTANAMKGDRDKCLAAGMDDYMSKPINPVVLERKVEKWLTKTMAVVKTNEDADHSDLGNSESAPLGDKQWDEQALLEAMKNRSDRVKILLQAFCGRMPATLEEFKVAQQSADNEKLGFIAHSTKGSAGQLKAYRLQHIAAELEHAVKDDAQQRIEQLSPLVYQESQALLNVLHEYLDN